MNKCRAQTYLIKKIDIQITSKIKLTVYDMSDPFSDFSQKSNHKISDGRKYDTNTNPNDDMTV